MIKHEDNCYLWFDSEVSQRRTLLECRSPRSLDETLITPGARGPESPANTPPTPWERSGTALTSCVDRAVRGERNVRDPVVRKHVDITGTRCVTKYLGWGDCEGRMGRIKIVN